MVKFNKSVSESNQNENLLEILKRICKLAQHLFQNPLGIYYQDYDLDDQVRGFHPYFFIAEVIRYRFLLIFSRESHRRLFAIHPGFYGSVNGERIVYCTLFDPLLLDIVNEEMKIYKEKFRATRIRLTRILLNSV